MKGLEAIKEGILTAQNSNLSTLGIRMNFINDQGFSDFFENLVFNNKSHLRVLYIQENNLTDYKAQELQQKLQQLNLLQSFFVDKFEKIDYKTDARMENTLYIKRRIPLSTKSKIDLIHMRLLESELRKKSTGLTKPPIRVRFGKKIWNKKSGVNAYAFVEFEDVLSIQNVTSLNSKMIVLSQYKTYVSGSQTFINIRRSKAK